MLPGVLCVPKNCTMKFTVFFMLATLSACSAQNDLSKDLLEFVKLLPRDEINAIVVKYYNDEDFMDIVMYIMYDEDFKEIVLTMEAVPEFTTVMDYLEDSGLEVYSMFNVMHDLVGLPPIVRPTQLRKVNSQKASSIFNQFKDEIRAIMSQEDIDVLHAKKLATSTAFKMFSDRILAQEYADIVKKMYDNEIIDNLINILMENGIDFKDDVRLYFELFGFKEIGAH